ncbi:MAG: hypothetical protein AAFY59_07580 [Pseudomonadota bacterium]
MQYHEFKNKDLEGFFNFVDYVVGQYETNLILPYGRAFSRAHTTFEKVLDDQRKADAFVADLIFVGLVVLTGVATAGIGSGVAAGAAAGGTRRVVVQGFVVGTARKAASSAPGSSLIMKALRQTGTALSAAYNSTTGKRVFAKLWPEVKTKLKLAGKNSLIQGLDSTAGTRTPNNALEAKLTLELEIKQIFNAAREYAIQLDKSTDLSEAEKSAKARELQTTQALVTAPAAVNEDLLEKHLLNGFFMTLLLNSDYTRSVSYGPYPGTSNYGPKKAVTLMPSDPAYPNALKERRYVLNGTQGVIDQPGSNIRKGVDEAYKSLRNEAFFTNGWFEPELDYAHLQKAEATLQSLATF